MTLYEGLDDIRRYRDGLETIQVVPAGYPPFVLGTTEEMTLLWGGSGKGKTWTALWILQRLSLLGVRGAVLATEGAPALADRILDLTWTDGYAPLLESRFTLSTSPKFYEDAFRRAKVKVVVVDVLSAMLSDENSAGEVNAALDRLRPLYADGSGRLLLCVHHSSDKARSNVPAAPRGSSRILDAAAYDFQVGAWHGDTSFGDEGGVWPLLTSGRKNRGGSGDADLSIRLGVEGGQVRDYPPVPPVPKRTFQDNGEVDFAGMLNAPSAAPAPIY